MAGEHYDDITADRYEYFIVDTGTFENRCPDPILESDHFPGKWRMVLACSGSSTYPVRFVNFFLWQWQQGILVLIVLSTGSGSRHMHN